MKTLKGLYLLLLVVPLLTATGAARDRAFTYSSLNYPGATLTIAYGMNPHGDIVGLYATATGVHGFVFRDGAFESIDFPGAVRTDARGISPKGEIVGTYRRPGENSLGFHGYLLNRKGEFFPIDYPGHLNTIPQRISANGRVVGCYHDNDTMGTMHGFLLNRKGFTGFDRPASMHNGITPDGDTMVGLYADMDAGRGRGYILEDGEFTPFDFPGSTSTAAWDVSPSGSVVGTYNDSASMTHGFLLADNQFTSLDYPGATLTVAFGINRRGVIVGTYVDASGRHAFVATPSRE